MSRFFIFPFSLVVPFVLLTETSFAITRKNTVLVAELQWSLCESAEVVLQKLGLQDLEKIEKKQSYLDARGLDLLQRSIQIRIREDGQSLTSFIKLNFESEKSLPDSLLDSEQTACEYDVYSDSEKIGCKVKNKTQDFDHPISSDQEKILKEFIDGNLMKKLKSFGSFRYQKWETEFDEGVAFTLDTLISATGKMYSEISVRVSAKDRHQLFMDWSRRFQQQHVQICPQRIDRTRELLSAP